MCATKARGANSMRFDVLMPLGRTNGGFAESPCAEAEALAMMDRFGVGEALVCHTLARGSNPDAGHVALSGLKSPRLHRIFAFDPAWVAPRRPETFLTETLAAGAKAVLVNPGMR